MVKDRWLFFNVLGGLLGIILACIYWLVWR